MLLYEEARAKTILEGRTGTGMFPSTTLRHQELADTVAYLSLLRKECPSRNRRPFSRFVQ